MLDGNESKYIAGGAILLARQIIDSEIFKEKPADWLKIWLYILCRVNWYPVSNYDVGEAFLTVQGIADATNTSKDQVKRALIYLRKTHALRTTKSTRGFKVKVVNYSRFQDKNSYKKPTPRTTLTNLHRLS